MARWTASAKWAVGPALDGQRDMPLALRLSEGLGRTLPTGMQKIHSSRGLSLLARSDTMMASTQQRTANDQRAYGCCQRRKPRALPTPAITNKRTTKTVWLRHWTVHAIARRQPVCRVAAGSPGSFMDANQPKAQSDVVVILSRKVGDLIRGQCGLTLALRLSEGLGRTLPAGMQRFNRLEVYRFWREVTR